MSPGNTAVIVSIEGISIEIQDDVFLDSQFYSRCVLVLSYMLSAGLPRDWQCPLSAFLCQYKM